MSIIDGLLLIFWVSQIYWAWRARAVVCRMVATTRMRLVVGGFVLALFLFLFAFNFGFIERGRTPVRMTLSELFFSAPFLWWVASSMVAFLIAVLFAIVKSLVRAASWIGRRVFASTASAPIESPERRQFLEQAAAVAVGAPFVAGAYGLLYGRLNVETTQQRIRLARLPKAFEGFRIAQLSDIHIGPFMSEEQIRKYVAIANALKPDLTVLTGDFVTWDPTTQQAAVDSLSGLRAPFGVFGCLGNHDAWAGVEDSITLLFRKAGIRILRQSCVPITAQGEALNLIGVDFQSRHRFGPSRPVRHLLAGIESIVEPDRVNILLSHNPNTFGRAAELGIDLSLAGHTHGGQLALEFISPEIAPSRLFTPYVAGWFQKPGGQLYVNRGIGTIGVPIRLGAPPEITVFELVRS